VRTILCAELATSHGGDVSLAEDMIKAAADAGCDLVKLQTYSLDRLKRDDPQRDWLIQAHLDEAEHERLLKAGQRYGVEVFSTPFDRDSLKMLRGLGLHRFKIASSEAGNYWWRGDGEFIVSWPWGRQEDVHYGPITATAPAWVVTHHLTAVPLYPTPLECMSAAILLDGLSDHAEGISVCHWAIAQGAQMLEFHLCLPGRSRVKPWDKTPEQARQIRDFADQVCTMTSGVSTVYRERWTA
jgi:N,N'-diacetyllegionaminate synthase